MNTEHLTDTEFIDYCLKFETDPKIVRLAKVMDEMPGFILQRLQDVGMNPETCLFENTYDPGDYIHHLENEIQCLTEDLNKAQDKVAELEALTVVDLIKQLRQRIDSADAYAESLRRQMKHQQEEVNQAHKQREEMKHKLDMWAILNR